MAIANNKKKSKIFYSEILIGFLLSFYCQNEGFQTMEIKKTFTEKVFSREKNNRFPQNNPTIKSKKKRHETLAKNDAIMKKNA
ncbi:hypothetical protein [Aeromonas caviae]|uniref:hypothetical protein n=1 Tax=Aeromonas caviae TaxID=648 RepID=UPI003F74A678